VVTYERALPYFELAASGGSLDRRRALLGLNAHALSTLATVNFLLHNFWRAAVLYETALMLHHQLDHVDDDAGSSSRSTVYLYIFILGFFRKPEKLGSYTGSK